MKDSKLNPAKAFLGVGWAFPPGLQQDGSVRQAVYEEDVRQAILIILGTNLGERVMRPDFGAGLRSFVFEPLNTTTLARIETRVREALIDWEPRIDVEEVKAKLHGTASNAILIHISYRVRNSNALHNLVYPFYIGEGA